MVVGGWDGRTYRNDVQIIDLSTQRKLCPNLQNYPLKLSAATGAIVSCNPIVCGGDSGSASSRYPQCHKYDNSTNSWTFLTNLTIGRDFSASVPLNDSLFVMGGNCEDDDVHRISSTEYINLDASHPKERKSFIFGLCRHVQGPPCLSVQSKLALTDRNMHAKKIWKMVLKS